jgi:hypothetical protein
LTGAPLADAPVGRTRGIDHSLKFTAARESGRFADASTLGRACHSPWLETSVNSLRRYEREGTSTFTQQWSHWFE